MNRKRVVSLGFAVATSVVTSFTFAGDTPDNAGREQTAIKVLSVANIVAEQDGRYHHARALAVEGTDSVSARVNAWLGKEQGWIDGWAKTLAFADLKEDLPYNVFQENLTHMLDGQSRTV